MLIEKVALISGGVRRGIIYFDSASLDDISRVFARWYGIQTKTNNPKLLNKQFAGIINKHEPIEVFLDNLKTISKINGSFDNQGILHFK